MQSFIEAVPTKAIKFSHIIFHAEIRSFLSMSFKTSDGRSSINTQTLRCTVIQDEQSVLICNQSSVIYRSCFLPHPSKPQPRGFATECDCYSKDSKHPNIYICITCIHLEYMYTYKTKKNTYQRSCLQIRLWAKRC